MDENSKIIAYDEKRGEPRKAKNVDSKKQGDCVSCGMCVKACPTGIDIREGLQMECIACTACIDACDTIMEKVKKPKGLIRYSSQNELEGKTRRIKTRSFVYLTLLIAVTIGAITQIDRQKDFRVQFLRGGKVPYQTISKPGQREVIVNHFVVSLSYYRHRGENIKLSLDDTQRKLGIKIISNENIIKLNFDNKRLNYFFQFPKDILVDGERKINVIFKDLDTDNIYAKEEVLLVGPIK